MFFIYRLNVHEIISALEDDHNIMSADIFITPPDNDDLSDEDSGSEEAGEISNLTRRQLLAEAEVRCQLPSADGVLETVDGIPFINSKNSRPHFSQMNHPQKNLRLLSRGSGDKKI